MSPSFTLVYILACVAAVFGSFQNKNMHKYLSVTPICISDNYLVKIILGAPGTKQAFPEDPEPINTGKRSYLF